MGLQGPGNAAFSGDGPLVTYKMVEVVAARHSGANEHNDLVIATDQAETLLDYLSEVIDCWEMKWEPGPPGGRRDGNIVAFKKAA